MFAKLYLIVSVPPFQRGLLPKRHKLVSLTVVNLLSIGVDKVITVISIHFSRGDGDFGNRFNDFPEGVSLRQNAGNFPG